MKRTESLYRTAVLLLLLMLAAACTRDDTFDDAAPGNATDPAAPLTITVTDGAYAPEASAANAATDNGAPVTRAVENGFATGFTKGDKIGLYVAKATLNNSGSPDLFDKMLHENLCLTYDGKRWTLPVGTELKYDPTEGRLYFAYYPYQADMDGKKPDGTSSEGWLAATAPEFFHDLIGSWKPLRDQSTYAAYTASDLMVARGVVTPRTDGTPGSLLNFKMEHQMMLYIFRFPGTTCTYTETIDGEVKQKSYDLYTGARNDVFWMENPRKLRRIENPTVSGIVAYDYSYYNSQLEKRKANFTHPYLDESFRGKYKTYTIDGGAETTTERPLAEGDFYMNDGTVLPQEAIGGGNLPNDVKKDCIGVVFWVGEIARIHWTQTGYKNGDHLLMRDHPECVHGMVVAMHDASQGAVFATGKGATESTYDWADSFSGFTPGEQADWEEIRNSDSTFGYSKPRLLTLYGTRHDDTTFPVLDAIAAYAAAYPVPASSSGWFLPGRNEFATLFFGVPQDFSTPGDPYYYQNLLMLKVINPRIRMASGDELNGGYWSSTEYGNSAWWIDVSPYYGIESKNKTYKVRAVLAF